MQQHQRFQIRQEPMPTHMHEELLLQGMLVGARYGTGMMLQGPHDILYAETKIVTPAGTHKIVHRPIYGAAIHIHILHI